MEREPQLLPFKTTIAGQLAQSGVRTLDSALTTGKSLVRGVRTIVKDVLYTPQPPPSTISGKAQRLIHNAGKEVLTTGTDIAKTLGLIDVTNLHDLPQLLDDEVEDIDLKRRFMRELMSGMGDELPLVQEMSRFAQVGFLRGIPPENLISFLQSKRILELLISQVLGLNDSPFDSINALEFTYRAIKAVRDNLENIVNNIDKSPMPADIEASLITDINYFKEHYNPEDKRYTIYKFVRTLIEKPVALEGSIPITDYSQYNVEGWLKEHSNLLTEILNEPDESGRPKKSHIANIVHGSYEEFAGTDPDQFIAIYLPHILKIHSLPDSSCVAQLNLHEVAIFFDRVVPRIQTGKSGPVELRSRLIEQCNREIEKYPDCTTIVIMDGRPGKGDEKRINRYQHESQREMISRIQGLIRNNTKILPSHFEIGVDPEEVSAQVKEDYGKFFDDEGKVTHAYYEHLRSMFELIGTETAEPFKRIRKRLARIYDITDQCLDTIDEKLELPPVQKFETITGTAEKADLLRIARTASTMEERFAARIKLELGNRIYETAYSQLYVSRSYNAAQMKLRLEKSRGGIAIDPEKEMTVIHFLDHPNGDVEEISSPETHGGHPDLKSISLIPATFGDIACHLLPPREHDPEEEVSRANGNYISKKSIFSLVMKAIRKRISEKQITDFLRMTFVVDTPKDLERMQLHLENNYLSFGKVLKRENRYDEMIDIATLHVDNNEFKSDAYQCLRYVLDIPIPINAPDQDFYDQNFYLVPIEIRILLKEDLLKEESAHNPASARKYQARKTSECARILRPRAIYPEIYENQQPNARDRFRTPLYTFKKRSTLEIP